MCTGATVIVAGVTLSLVFMTDRADETGVFGSRGGLTGQAEVIHLATNGAVGINFRWTA